MSDFEILAGSHGRFLAYSPDLITSQIRQFGAHTRPEIAFLASAIHPGDKIVDAGAHIGTFAVPLAKAAGATGRVLAVEADDLTCSVLKINISLNQLSHRVVCVNAAIGPREESRGRLVVPQGNTGAAAFEPGGSGVRLRPLSEILREHEFQPVDVIKMDVEGMEFDIVSDLHEMLAQTHPVIYFEVSQRLTVNGAEHATFDAMLKDLGYRLFRNTGERNASHDRFSPSELPALPRFTELCDILCLHHDSARIGQVLGGSGLVTTAA